MHRFDFNRSVDLKPNIWRMQKNHQTNGIKFDPAGFFAWYFTGSLLFEQQGNAG